MRNIKTLKKLNDWSYSIFVLGYDILQSMLNMYDIPCDVAFEYCTNLHSTYISSPESEQDKSDYECLQDYVDNHMYEIESEIKELAKKYSDYDKEDCVMSKEIISRNLTEDGVLEIYLGNALLCTIVDGRNNEDFVEDVLQGLGYKWNEDGTISPLPIY